VAAGKSIRGIYTSPVAPIGPGDSWAQVRGTHCRRRQWQ